MQIHSVPLEEFGEIIENAIIVLNRDGLILHVNNAAIELLGFSRRELLGKKHEIYIPPEYLEIYSECLNRVIKSGKLESIMVEILSASKCRIPAELKIWYSSESQVVVNVISKLDVERSLINIHKEILDMIIRGENTEKIANYLCRKIGDIIPNSHVGIAINKSSGREIHFPEGTPAEFAEILENPPFTSDLKKISTKDGIALLSPLISSEREILGFIAVYKKSGIVCQSEIDIIEAASKLSSVVVDIENKKDKLQKACISLRSIDEIKSCIIANVRHELLTPVTLIGAAMDLLEDKLVGEKDTVDCIRRNLDRLKELVEDLLEVARLYRGEVYLRFAEFRIGDVITEAIEEKLEFSRKKNVEVLWSGEDFHIYADKLKIKKALVNLLDNAIKFNKPGGKVHILAQKRRGEAVIEVRDTGVGIPRDRLRDIFTPLTQLDFSTDRQHSGIGIGLAVVKRIAELHSGRVEVKSQRGKGSSFYLILPLK